MMLVLTDTKFIAYLCTKTTLHTTIEAMNADRVHLRGGGDGRGIPPPPPWKLGCLLFIQWLRFDYVSHISSTRSVSVPVMWSIYRLHENAPEAVSERLKFILAALISHCGTYKI